MLTRDELADPEVTRKLLGLEAQATEPESVLAMGSDSFSTAVVSVARVFSGAELGVMTGGATGRRSGASVLRPWRPLETS